MVMINYGDSQINVIPRVVVTWGDFEEDVKQQTPIQIILKTEMIALNARLMMHRTAIEDWENFQNEFEVIQSENDFDEETESNEF